MYDPPILSRQNCDLGRDAERPAEQHRTVSRVMSREGSLGFCGEDLSAAEEEGVGSKLFPGELREIQVSGSSQVSQKHPSKVAP